MVRHSNTTMKGRINLTVPEQGQSHSGKHPTIFGNHAASDC